MQDASLFPEAFTKRLEQIVPHSLLASVKEAQSSRRPTIFRTNTLKISTSDLLKKLDQLGIKYGQVKWFDDAFILESSHTHFMATGLFDSGLIYVQSLSSMIPPLVLDPKPGESVLDLTAAPGSKTSQMAAMMKNSGVIVANDISRIRLYKLKANMDLLGVANVTITRIPGQLIWKKYSNFFDKTLVDAPCSLEGRFCSLEPKTYKTWNEKKPTKLSKMQKYLLRSAVSATKPGGLIVYSTCTISPEENEEVIDWILEKEKGNVRLEAINLELPQTMPAIRQWRTKSYTQEIKKTLRVLPSAQMEGFFIAKLRKK